MIAIPTPNNNNNNTKTPSHTNKSTKIYVEPLNPVLARIAKGVEARRQAKETRILRGLDSLIFGLVLGAECRFFQHTRSDGNPMDFPGEMNKYEHMIMIFHDLSWWIFHI